jgi:hypothetical protein
MNMIKFWKVNMKKNKWIIDAFALIALLLVFIPDLTGFTVHEWIGLAIAGVLLVHFLQHWDWAISTTQRLGKLKAKVLGNYLVNAGLAVGFLTITVTGLVISALLMLPLANYEIWRLIHVISSYLTAFLLAVKLIMHWDMIAKVMKNIIGVDKETMTLEEQKRRKFLRGASFTTIAGLFAFAEFREWQNKTPQSFNSDISADQDSSDTVVELVPTLQPTEILDVIPVDNAEEAVGSNFEIDAPTQEPDQLPTATSEPTIEPTQPESAVIGVVKCRRACSYPGRCGRYVDDNNNNQCDLGEPIW